MSKLYRSDSLDSLVSSEDLDQASLLIRFRSFIFLFFFALAVPAVLASLVRPSVHFSMLAGVLAFCLHAWWDFPAQCPSVLLLLVFILVIIGRLGTLDVSKQRIDNDPL